MKIKAKDILPFLGFFLITIGNGKYLGAKFGDLIEYLGIVVLLILCYWPSKTNHVSITETIKVLLLTLLLSIGAFIKGAPTKACYMIALTSFALMSFALKSQSVLSTNKRIKIAANAIFSGAVFSALIGSITGTLGLTLGSDESIVGILYVSGFQVKNYCGGIWMLLFVLNYIYFKRTNRINTKRSVYTLCAISIFLILSGSKGACVLCVLFVLGVNYNKIVSLKKEQKKVFGVIFGAILILMAIYLYNNILINIKTYAYRMRGFQNLLDYMLDDSKRLMFGISDIAYADNGNTYVNNIRSFLGWEASVEMAHVNILIKNGLLGVFPYIMIYKSYISEKKYLNSVDKSILLALIIPVSYTHLHLPASVTIGGCMSKEAIEQKEVIVGKLKDSGCRITKQRLILLDVILEGECGSCKEIYYRASKIDHSIGTATVYRMINTLEEIGAIDRKNMYRVQVS